MGRLPTIDAETGMALLEAFQRHGNVSAAAREVGVKRSTAARYLEATPPAAAPVIAQQRAVIEAKGASLFDTRAALEGNYGRILKLIEQLEAGIVLTDDEEEYETRVSPTILVSALREAREHITAGMKLYQLMLDVDEVRKFQEAVLEAIGEADAPTRDRIKAKLQQRRALGFVA